MMTKPTAKTIEIFLPDGDPKSIRVASITSRTVEVTYIPRTKLVEARNRDNLNGVGVYMLVGLSEEHSKPEVYLGEAENCMVRLGQHNAGKDFWKYALVITSRTSQFTKTHGKYLEWLCFDTGKQAGRCIIHNLTIPTKPHVSEPMEADLHDSFEAISVLIGTLGLPLFQPARGDKGTQPEQDGDLVFRIKGRGGEAEGMLTEEGFVVLADSKFAKDLAPSLAKRSPPKIREQLINDSTLVDKQSHFELAADTIFNSPSTAGVCVTGRSTNGWTAWKLPDKRTLSDVYRKEKV